MIVALGSLHREAGGIIRAGDYSVIEAPEDFLAYRPTSPESPADTAQRMPVIVLSGTGTGRAGRATQWAIEEFSPEAIVSFGFCGATRDHEQSGDIVISARVVNVTGTPFEWSMTGATESLGPDRTLQLAARTAVEVAGLDYHHGTVVTTSRVAKTSGMKRWLGEAMNAAAVDTQAHAVASAASKAGIPWLSVLSVLAPWDYDLPSVTDRLGSGPRPRAISAYARYFVGPRQRGKTAYLRQLRQISGSPSKLPALFRLGRSSKRAGTSLRVFMAAFMEALSALRNADQST